MGEAPAGSPLISLPPSVVNPSRVANKKGMTLCLLFGGGLEAMRIA